jgi:hypothetical protein
MFQTKVVEKIKMHFLCSIKFSENCDICEIMWKRGRAGVTTDDSIRWWMCIACWITKATNTYCFSMATMVMETCPSVTLYKVVQI